jgi:hypothetical protein
VRYHSVDWGQAACRGIDTDLFYSDDHVQSWMLAPTMRRMCHACPIYDDCLEYALWNEVHGFWAGLTEKQRQTMRGRLRRGEHAA